MLIDPIKMRAVGYLGIGISTSNRKSRDVKIVISNIVMQKKCPRYYTNKTFETKIKAQDIVF